MKVIAFLVLLVIVLNSSSCTSTKGGFSNSFNKYQSYITKNNLNKRVLLEHNYKYASIYFEENDDCMTNIYYPDMIKISGGKNMSYKLVDNRMLDSIVIDTLIFNKNGNRSFLKNRNLTFFKIKKVDTSFTNRVFPCSKEVIITPQKASSAKKNN